MQLHKRDQDGILILKPPSSPILTYSPTYNPDSLPRVTAARKGPQWEQQTLLDPQFWLAINLLYQQYLFWVKCLLLGCWRRWKTASDWGHRIREAHGKWKGMRWPEETMEEKLGRVKMQARHSLLCNSHCLWHCHWNLHQVTSSQDCYLFSVFRHLVTRLTSSVLHLC